MITAIKSRAGLLGCYIGGFREPIKMQTGLLGYLDTWAFEKINAVFCTIAFVLTVARPRVNLLTNKARSLSLRSAICEKRSVRWSSSAVTACKAASQSPKKFSQRRNFSFYRRSKSTVYGRGHAVSKLLRLMSSE